MTDLFLSNNRIAVFLEQKKSQITINTKGFSIARGTNIFRTRSDSYILAKKNLVNNNLRYNLTPRACKFNPL